MYGKKASDLGNFKMSRSGAVSGNFRYVTGYTGFNGADPEEQEGYYFPVAFKRSEEAKEAYMQVMGSEKEPVKMDPENVLFLGKDPEKAKEKRIAIICGKDRWTIHFKNADFERGKKNERRRKAAHPEKRPAEDVASE